MGGLWHFLPTLDQNPLHPHMLSQPFLPPLSRAAPLYLVTSFSWRPFLLTSLSPCISSLLHSSLLSSWPLCVSLYFFVFLQSLQRRIFSKLALTMNKLNKYTKEVVERLNIEHPRHGHMLQHPPPRFIWWVPWQGFTTGPIAGSRWWRCVNSSLLSTFRV